MRSNDSQRPWNKRRSRADRQDWPRRETGHQIVKQVDELLPRVELEGAKLLKLRQEVRAFAKEVLDSGRAVPTPDSWLRGWDPEFSRLLADRGWVGMTIPERFG